jgi:feruloyl esterase
LATASGPKYGLFDALEAWVEKGVPAGDVVATKYETGAKGEIRVKMTRPFCPYPQVAKYKGAGDTNDSANFVCVAE